MYTFFSTNSGEILIWVIRSGTSPLSLTLTCPHQRKKTFSKKSPYFFSCFSHLFDSSENYVLVCELALNTAPSLALHIHIKMLTQIIICCSTHQQKKTGGDALWKWLTKKQKKMPAFFEKCCCYSNRMRETDWVSLSFFANVKERATQSVGAARQSIMAREAHKLAEHGRKQQTSKIDSDSFLQQKLHREWCGDEETKL